MKTSTVRESQPATSALLDRYVETFKRKYNDGEEQIKSMYLWSEAPRTCKTTTASALINAWIATDYLSAIKAGNQPGQTSAYFLDINELQTSYNLATMTNDDDGIERMGAKIKRTQDAPFAVIDDIGVRDATTAYRSYVHAVINYRPSNGMSTVYTSNLPIEDMAEVFDDRIYVRIRDQCAPIHFAGGSRRGRR